MCDSWEIFENWKWNRLEMCLHSMAPDKEKSFFLVSFAHSCGKWYNSFGIDPMRLELSWDLSERIYLFFPLHIATHLICNNFPVTDFKCIFHFLRRRCTATVNRWLRRRCMPSVELHAWILQIYSARRTRSEYQFAPLRKLRKDLKSGIRRSSPFIAAAIENIQILEKRPKNDRRSVDRGATKLSLIRERRK